MNKIVKVALSIWALAIFAVGAAYAQAATQPTLKIVTPSEAQTIYGTKVPVLLAVENFQLVESAQYPTNASGQGHVNLWLDDPSPTQDSATKVAANEFIYSDVGSGDHTLIAELVNNNNAPQTPAVKATINFKTSPVASPSPIAASGFDKKTGLIILAIVAAVIVAAWWYTKEEPEATVKAVSAAPKTKKKAVRTKRSKGRKA